MHTKFWLVNLKGKRSLGKSKGKNYNESLGKQGWREWIRFIWLRIGTCGGLL
jgi:hypothetical protein